jgi:hypothetical protein
MPHQTPHAPNATAQNAATEPQPPNDQARGQNRAVHPEARSYAAKDWEDASLATPAAGEVGDYADEGAPSGGAQQGSDRRNIPEKNAQQSQGAKTQAEQRRLMDTGSPDQGTE